MCSLFRLWWTILTSPRLRSAVFSPSWHDNLPNLIIPSLLTGSCLTRWRDCLLLSQSICQSFTFFICTVLSFFSSELYWLKQENISKKVLVLVKTISSFCKNSSPALKALCLFFCMLNSSGFCTLRWGLFLIRLHQFKTSLEAFWLPTGKLTVVILELFCLSYLKRCFVEEFFFICCSFFCRF